MTDIKFEYGEFEDVRKQLIADINKKLTSKDQELLVSFALGEPKWELASIAKMKDIPAPYRHLPIYQVTYELLQRSTAIIKDFPREYKFTIGQKLQDEIIGLVVLI